MDDCIFCKIVKKEIPVDMIYESDNFIVFPDANPQVEGHCLIVPKQHFVNSFDLPSVLGSELLDVFKKVAEIYFKKGFEGFNLIQNNFSCAGQVVNHFHFHFLPRKKEDGKKIEVI